MEEKRSKPIKGNGSVQSSRFGNNRESVAYTEDTSSPVEFKLDSFDHLLDVQSSPSAPNSKSAASVGNSINTQLNQRQRSEMKADMFILANAKYFEGYQLPILRNYLLQMDDARWSMIQFLSFTNPFSVQLVSFFIGSWGVDRFLIGDTRFGLIKLFTFGGLGFLTIYDWFMIQRATRERNWKKLQLYL